MFSIQNGQKYGDALLPLLFNFALEYTIRKVQKNQVGVKLNRIHQLLAYANVNQLGDNTETPTDASKVAGLEVNAEKTKYTLLSHH
jgi:hypothetical protein